MELRILDFKHIFDSIATAFAETLWPTRCVGCDLPGTLLCAQCIEKLPSIDLRQACPRCGAPYGRLVCTQCTAPGATDKAGRVLPAPFPFAQARAAYSFEGIAKRVITCYKDQDELRLDTTIAAGIVHAMRADLQTTDDRQDSGQTAATAQDTEQTAPVLQSERASASSSESRSQTMPASVATATAPLEDWTQWADAVVPIPSTSKAIQRRGYDHLERIACLVSQWSGVALLHALVSCKAIDQRLLSSHERIANRTSSLALARPLCPLPPHIVLIDDVLTTGATTSAASKVLLERGAREVRVAVFARVW